MVGRGTSWSDGTTLLRLGSQRKEKIPGMYREFILFSRPFFIKVENAKFGILTSERFSSGKYIYTVVKHFQNFFIVQN